METFVNVVTSINNLVWAIPLVVLCVAAGIFCTVITKGCQFRLFGDMIKLIREENEESKEKGISAFQSFAATVGARVGMGNIAGVATAIFFGGPGAVFWMWLIALLGAATSFAECTLAQAYKDKVGDQYLGGAQIFITKALHLKPLAYLFAIAAVLGPGTLMPGLQVYQIATTVESAFGVPQMIIGVAAVICIALVVMGGIKRIGKVAELLAPLMCIVYIIMALIIMAMNLDKVPGVFAQIFSAAFGADKMFGGILGAMVSWGVKRGVYSNEAGQGSGAIVSAAAECSHPAKQGLIQALSVFIDTILVCTASAMIILCTDNYTVVDGVGNDIVRYTDSEYGALWVQDAIYQFMGNWGAKLLAIMIALFVFTSLMGYYYQAESNMRFIFKDRKAGTYLMRAIFLVAVFSGVIVDGQTIWSMADLGVGLMAWINIIVILILWKKVKAILADYEAQKKKGQDPMFDSARFGIKDDTGAWTTYANKLKEREASQADKK